MKLTDFAIKEIATCVKDCNNGKTWVDLFNSFGFRDVYDEGLPDIGKPNGQRPTKTEYIKQRLKEKNGTNDLANIIVRIAQMGDLLPDALNKIIKPENYEITDNNGNFIVIGDVPIREDQDLKTKAHFQDIQNQILNELNKARVSIVVVVAWFTNQTLADKLIEKYEEGLDVKVAIMMTESTIDLELT